jgi:uncharacterized membrane protein YcaP (DUF421 family)
MDSRIFFDDWDGILRTVIAVAVAYPAMLLMVRLAGHRTLAKMNAFDFIVSVALGSTLADVITVREVALSNGLTAFALLIGLQVVLSWSTTWSRSVEHWLNGDPVVLARGEDLYRDQMLRERVTEEELKAILRSHGVDDFGRVKAVVLETNGEISVVQP